MNKREWALVFALAFILAGGISWAAKVWRFDAIQIPNSTTSTYAVNFGNDVAAYRDATARLRLAATMYVQDDTILGHDSTHTATIAGATTVGSTLGVTGTLTAHGNTALGDASTNTVTCTGRLVLRTLGADPLGGTPPAGTVGEIAVYSNRLYLCTAATPTWIIVGPPAT